MLKACQEAVDLERDGGPGGAVGVSANTLLGLSTQVNESSCRRATSAAESGWGNGGRVMGLTRKLWPGRQDYQLWSK